MALKDTFKNIFTYFEIDDSNDYEDQREEDFHMAPEPQPMRVAPQPVPEPARNTDIHSELRRTASRSQLHTEKNNLQRLNERQQELMGNGMTDRDTKATIDIKFPKKYEDAPEIVELLLGNASVLIDFQYMSETQARRCLDYLDGARSVLAGSLKKVSNTMWLLTPVNVTVNIEELRAPKSTASDEDGQYDFDMRR